MNELTGHWRASFDNKYLGAWNLWNAKTSSFTTVSVTIDRIYEEQVVRQGGQKSMATLISFKGKRTPMILTKTMGKAIQAMYGRSPGEWIGKEITLYVEVDVHVQGGVGDVLRIRNTAAGKGLRRRLAPQPVEDDGPVEEVVPVEQFGGDDA